MNVIEYMKTHRLYLDGGMGTLLQTAGHGGECAELLSLSDPDLIRSIHSDYLRAGSNVIITNTFGANSLKLSDKELESSVKASVRIAREAIDGVTDGQARFVALDVGPLGKMLEPFGDYPFESAVDVFKKTVSIGVGCGVDLIFIETMNDITEARAALLAAKETTSLPVFVSCAYGSDGRLMTGAEPEAAVAILEGMGACAVGVNCSLGPKALLPIVKRYLDAASVPVLVKPNAGLPRAEGSKTVYDVSADEFCSDLSVICEMGASGVGGCCGTTPEYIEKLVTKTESIPYNPTRAKNLSVVASLTKAVYFAEKPLVIGERINPTGKKLLKEAILRGDLDYLYREGIREEDAGADILEVNVGIPGINEAGFLTDAVKGLAAITSLPLSIDTTDVFAMEAALRAYSGKALINSVSAKEESMRTVFPLMKKYGGVAIALTLDEDGIPKTAEQRFLLAERILKVAREYGLDKKDLIFDPLAMSVSADPDAARQTLSAVRMINERLGARTVLGVSNVSFGLPEREALVSSYLSAAISMGLSAAIMNPLSPEVMRAYRAAVALRGCDPTFGDYISYMQESSITVSKKEPARKAENEAREGLADAIIHGLSDSAAAIVSELITSRTPLEIIEGEIIPALDTVGRGFEEKRIYLPTLLLSAEAAAAAFEVIKSAGEGTATPRKAKVILATVKGDVHDIGKNIVRLMLETYGFSVTDLGRDAEPTRILQAAREISADVVGLSALMTTTTPAMEETVKLLHRELPGVRVIVGGAVLSESYARSMGADAYAPDAMGAVRYLEDVEKTLL